jgi:hypothetical protein
MEMIRSVPQRLNTQAQLEGERKPNPDHLDYICLPRWDYCVPSGRTS